MVQWKTSSRRRILMDVIFDVDGTLTPSRDKIDPQFAEWFKQFVTVNTVCLVTGSDRIKTIEQIGEMLFNMCDMAYNPERAGVNRFMLIYVSLCDKVLCAYPNRRR